MIGKLHGKIEEVHSQGVVLNVGGVGYDVTLPLSVLAAMPPIDHPADLWIHTHVREDDLRLFGFGTKRDRTAFRTMLKISGVGPKLALAVIGVMSGDQLAQAIRLGDVKRLCSIPGIGKKTAERIVLELGGKLKLDQDEAATQKNSTLDELNSALKNLGFKTARVERVLAEIGDQDAAQPFEEMLRRALSLLQE